MFYFTSDKLNKALADALADNATTVKNALEIAVRNGGKAMPETDENGHSKVGGLEQGLYLVVETRVPGECHQHPVTRFVSLPMTTIDGKDWNYDVPCTPRTKPAARTSKRPFGRIKTAPARTAARRILRMAMHTPPPLPWGMWWTIRSSLTAYHYL